MPIYSAALHKLVDVKRRLSIVLCVCVYELVARRLCTMCHRNVKIEFIFDKRQMSNEVERPKNKSLYRSAVRCERVNAHRTSHTARDTHNLQLMNVYIKEANYNHRFQFHFIDLLVFHSF